MKAAYLTGIGQMEVGDMPDATLSGDCNVLVRMAAVGICGSDVHNYASGGIGSKRVAYPFTVGHEGAGVVVAVGEGVTRVKPGDRIAIEPALSCGQCDQCLAGRANTCRKITFMSTAGEAQGLLSECVAVPEANCFPVPDGMTLEQAALAEPMSIAVYSVKQSIPITPETRIAILGAGPIGLGVLAVCKAHGAQHVYVTDKLPYRLDVARKLGATWTGNPDTLDVVAAVREAEPLQVDVVFECCGKQEALDQAVDMLKPGGKLMVVGIPEQSDITFCIDTIRRNEITIYNVRRQRDCVGEAIELVASGRVDSDAFITHRFPLDETPKAFDMVHHYADGVIKAIITNND